MEENFAEVATGESGNFFDGMKLLSTTKVLL